MKIESIYYIEEPEDLDKAAFEVRILLELDEGGEGGREYAFEVMIINFMKEYIGRKNKENQVPYLCSGYSAPLLVVEKAREDIIINAINELLPDIEKVALRIE